MESGEKLTLKGAWELLAEKWSQADLVYQKRHIYFADFDRFHYGLCSCIEFLHETLRVISQYTHNRMMGALLKYANEIGLSLSGQYLWSEDAEGAAARAQFCKTQAEKS